MRKLACHVLLLSLAMVVGAGQLSAQTTFGFDSAATGTFYNIPADALSPVFNSAVFTTTDGNICYFAFCDHGAQVFGWDYPSDKAYSNRGTSGSNYFQINLQANLGTRRGMDRPGQSHTRSLGFCKPLGKLQLPFRCCDYCDRSHRYIAIG
jgi:hypothetical protein